MFSVLELFSLRALLIQKDVKRRFILYAQVFSLRALLIQKDVKPVPLN